MSDLKLKVPTVVELRPLEFVIGCDEGLGSEVGSGEGDVLTVAKRLLGGGHY